MNTFEVIAHPDGRCEAVREEYPDRHGAVYITRDVDVVALETIHGPPWIVKHLRHFATLGRAEALRRGASVRVCCGDGGRHYFATP